MNRPSGGRELTEVGGRRGADLHSRSCALEDVSFGAIVDTDHAPRVQWATPDGLEVVGCGVAARFEATDGDRFSQIRSQAERAFDGLEYEGPAVARPRAFGGFAFHEDHVPTGIWQGFGAASFVIPRVQVTRSDRGCWLTATAEGEAAAEQTRSEWKTRIEELPAMRPSGDSPGIESTTWTTTKAAWIENVEATVDRIGAGELTKVVLAQSLSVSLAEPIDVPATLERLRRRYPGCYRFAIDYDEAGPFFGASPERLVSQRGNHIETEALAGSIARGETTEEDEALADEMRDSEKLRHEHELVVDAIRDQLSGAAATLSVGERTIRRLANIQHLQTPIEARLETDRHVLDTVESLHPTPAVGGVPPGAARETIRSTESFDRGWYAAPVGWFDAAGDGEFAVALRSGLVGDGTVTLFAGNGIVADSAPEEEWAEVTLKFDPILGELR
ncbi:isochorismate synthase [Halobacteria archaeon AArc-dxtr1]|nr:isochorismate synthase [Halobacteria archaeon AArc-dxtr1]